MVLAKIKEWIRLILVHIRMLIWKKDMGLKSKWNLFMIFVFLYSLYAVLKKYGLWFKKSIQGKHVFLTGVGSGLGRLVSIRLAKLGAKLTIVDINEPSCQQTKRMIKAQASNENVQVFHLDVANREQIKEVA